MADQFLDLLHGVSVVRRGDGKGLALQSRATGAADAMDVVLGMDRHIEIEHVRQAADVEAACRHVAAHQQPKFVGLELLQCREPDGLRHVPVQRASIEMMLGQRFMQDIDVALAIAEDQGVLHVLTADQPPQCLPLIVFGDQCQTLGDRCGNRGGA